MHNREPNFVEHRKKLKPFDTHVSGQRVRVWAVTAYLPVPRCCVWLSCKANYGSRRRLHVGQTTLSAAQTSLWYERVSPACVEQHHLEPRIRFIHDVHDYVRI